MFLGPGGSGKSSLLAGLMNTSLPNEAESTVLVDTRTVSYKWIASTDMGNFTWKLYSDEDETKNLAAKAHILAKARIIANKLPMAMESPVTPDEPEDRVSCLQSDTQTADSNFSRNISKIGQDYYKDVVEQAKQGVEGTTEVVMHIWDCGGQPIFLDIISAFLTSRTMFLLLFDGSIDLNSMYQEKWHHKGQIILGREQNTTHIQLMKQWLQLIHSSLVAKDNAYGQSEQSQITTSCIPKCPRAMVIGTRGDEISSAKFKTVAEKLNEVCSEAAFGDIVVDKLIVDNTKAGKSKDGEDPGYEHIREKINKFAYDLKVNTPLAWVAFRQVLQKAASEHPIISYSQACIIAKECEIQKRAILSVLHFYHQLGAMLHYADIPSLANSIIVKPQWLIDQLCKLLKPEWYGERPQHLKRLWKVLEESGILTEVLYQEIWQDCGLKGGGQALVDLLEHFDLAHEMINCPGKMLYKGKNYFMPCMLQSQPKDKSGENQLNDTREDPSFTRKAATLLISFNMGYVPPGFFVRFIVQMAKNKDCNPLLKVYRDSITFQYKEIDRIIITESLTTIEVNIRRIVMRKQCHVVFKDSCLTLCREITKTCEEVLHNWMPTITMRIAFKCTCSKSDREHFVLLKPDTHQQSTLFCDQESEYRLSQEHKFWLPPGKIPSVSQIYTK